MKLLIQLLIVAVVLHGCVRAGQAAWRFYAFKDTVEQTVRFGGGEPVATLQQRILDLAAEQEVPLDPRDLSVHREGTRTTVSASYWDYIELVPSFYTREHLFEMEVQVNPVRPVTADDLKQ